MKALLVDDDRFVIIALQKGIDWKSLGIDETFTAYNIADAGKIIEKEHIDLLLSDIDMPHGSGLELLTKVRELGLTIPAIFMTNYADFGYAQKALELKSFHYYLKPIDYDELSKIIRQALEESNASASKNKAAFRQLWYRYLLEKRITSDEFMEMSKKLGKAITEDDAYTVSLLQLYPYSLGENSELICPFEDVNEVLDNIHSIFDSVYGADYSSLGIFLAYHEESYLMLSVIPAFDETRFNDGKNLETISEEIISVVRERYNIPCTLYLSQKACVTELPGALEALMKLRERHPDNINKVMSLNYLDITESHITPKPDTQIAAQALKSSDFDGFSRHFKSYMKNCLAAGSLSSKVLSDLLFEINQIIFSYLNENGIMARELFNNETYRVLTRNARLSTYYMDLYITYMMRVARQYLASEPEDENAVSSLLQYVDAHFREEISRSDLSEMFFFDPDYITRIFKRERGMSYKNYIIEKRLTLAKKLLKETDSSIRDVSLMVGYDNYSYFTRLFKKSYGVTPAEFRQNLN